jgi:hypothetical protein
MSKNKIKEWFNEGTLTLEEAFSELLWGWDLSRKEAANFLHD